MLSWRRHWAYFQYVWNHKVAVYKAGRSLGLPRLRLLLHDLSKFYPDEWFAYARTFYNPDGSKKDYQMPETQEFLGAWALHQKRNSHHWQYYVYLIYLGNQDYRTPLREDSDLLVMDRGDLLTTKGAPSMDEALAADPMSDPDALEMLADWLSFGTLDTCREWYLKTRDQKILHPETKVLIERLLGVSQN